MPSGAKRRKAAAAAAAKKKKEKESPTLTPSGSQATSFNGGDNLKGKESDGGELSSPASQDPIQSGGHSFTEEGVEKDSPPVRKIEAEKVNEEEEVGIVKVDEDQGRVEITRELKLNEVLEGGGDLSVEVGKNTDGSSSSSSSSDDEEVHIEKTQVVLDSEVVEVYDAVENSVDSQVTAVVLEGLVETADESQVAAVVFEELKESADDSLAPAVVLEEVVETADESQVAAVVFEELKESADDSLAPAVVLEEVVETADDPQVPAAVLEEVVETPDEAQVPNVVLEEVIYVSETVPVEKNYEDLGKPVLSELNDELKAAEDGDLPLVRPTYVSLGETSNVNRFNAKDVEDNVLPPSDSPISVTRNGVGHHPKSPEIQDSFDNQPPLLQAPLSVQRTSWKGCCGLFEVFTGSR